MLDPATGAIIGTVSGSLTLVNALIRICQEHDKDPKATPSNVAELIAALPAAALKATDDLIKQVEALRDECRAAGIDLDLTLDELLQQSWFFQRRRRRVLKTFQGRIDGIASEITTLFDDVVSVSDCADRLNAIARSFEASRQQKEKLRDETNDTLPLGKILHNLQAHAERARAELGDLNRKK
jgi:hypothetical protein